MAVGAPLVAAPPEGQAPPADKSTAEIRNAVRKSREALRSLMLEFEITPGPLEPKPKPGRSHHRLAARGPLRFTENRHSYHPIPAELDPDYHRGYYAGDSFTVFYPRERYCEIVRRDSSGPHSLKIRRPIAVECLGWWPPDDASALPPEDPPFLLHEVLARPDCAVLPRQEKVGERWCHVVEVPGVDRIWLDGTCGFAIRRRDRYRGGQPPRSTVRYELSDYDQVSDGVWIPRRMRRTVYGSAGGGGAAEAVQSDISVTVVGVRINDDVPASIFRFEPPAGTLISERDTGEFRQVPGGLELLDQVPADSLTYARIRADGSSNTMAAWLGQSRDRTAGRDRAYAACALFAAVGAGGFVLWRLRHRAAGASRLLAREGGSPRTAVGARRHGGTGEPDDGHRQP